jgi:glycosyltransferase involved in cell wall biosynthesis
MKIGLYDPYFDSYGGGERYILTLARHWSETHDVKIFWDDTRMLSEAEERFDMNLGNVEAVPNIFAGKNLLRKLSATTAYDCILFLSDGSVPMSFAKYNILHFQVPFAHVNLPWWKAQKYQRIVCNSEFTQKNLDPSLTIHRSVIYPPVDTQKMKETQKTHTILSVGRFSSLYGAKKHEVLLRAFRKAQKAKGLAGWKMIIAGGLLPSDRAYFHQLKTMAKGLPVEFHANCTFHALQLLYGSAAIYWHAAGYGESKPERMEHFGITTVEAMGAGCVPAVFNGGGQPEIVDDNHTGILWNTPDELIQKTISIIQKKNALEGIKRAAKKRAGEFSVSRFTKSFDSLLSEI